MSIIWNDAEQGSEEWLAARRGVITASMVRVALETTAKGAPTAKALGYAMNIARERAGGTVEQPFVNAAMRLGTQQEEHARIAYEDATGKLVSTRGFAHTEDRLFGGSPDGLIDLDGGYECKTMVSSDTLFRAVVDGDISDYRQQCVFLMWLLTREWWDLHLWVHDIPSLSRVIRIERNEKEIEALEESLMGVAARVLAYENQLRSLMAKANPASMDGAWALPATAEPSPA